jgi:hypothetical protein
MSWGGTVQPVEDRLSQESATARKFYLWEALVAAILQTPTRLRGLQLPARAERFQPAQIAQRVCLTGLTLREPNAIRLVRLLPHSAPRAFCAFQH